MTAPDSTRAVVPAPAGDVPSSRRAAVLLVAVLTALCTACSTPGPPPPAAAPAAPPAPVVPPPEEPPAPAPPPPPPPAAPARPEALSNPQEVLRALSTVLEMLQSGQQDPAEAELKRVLAAEPGNRLAQSLLRQIREDPQVLLGRESFSYRVRPGESLSRLAQRFLNDPHLFYALARYNGIKVPRALTGGALLRIPGKAPATAALPPAAPAGAAPRPPSSPVASASAAASASPPASTSAPAASPVVGTASAGAGNDAARAAQQKAEAVARHTRAARAAFAKQDLDGALRAWDAVLAIDPENRTAQLERQKAQGLKDKLGSVK